MLEKPVHFSDLRGTIGDLLGHVDSVTEIVTKHGFVRGNHTHHHTTQWTYVVEGLLQVQHGTETEILKTGDFFVDPPGMPHAWKALTDSRVLVMTKGPRSGANYEDDTERLETPLL